MKKMKCYFVLGFMALGVNSFGQGSFWLLNGNAGVTPATQFLGTTDNNRLVFRTNNIERATIQTNGNVGIATNAPNVRLAIGGVGGNIYATDVWTENNQHVQGNENLAQGGRGRLRVGTAWGHVGLYSETSSSGANNDLILGASSGIVRVGPNPATSLQSLLVSGRVMTSNTTNVLERTNRLNGLWPNETIDGLNGVHVYHAEGEQGGFFANSNYCAIYSPGDKDIVRFFDEDGFNGAGLIEDGPFNPLRARIDNAGYYWQVSDRAQKTNILPVTGGLNRVLQLNGYTYDMMQNPEEIEKGSPVIRSAGIIAQELEAVLPEAVSSENHQPGTFMVNYAAMTSLFVEAIKDLNKKIEELQAKIDQICAGGCGVIVPTDGKGKTAIATGNGEATGADVLYQSIPNPTSDIATINYSLQKGYQQAAITIYAQDGKPVKTISLNATAGDGSIKVGLAGFKNGSYVYTLTADGNVIGSKTLLVVK